MYVRKKNEDAVSPVIAVILMVAITVVLAGVLYVWVTSLADTSSTTTQALGVSAKDASAVASVGAAPKSFATTDDFIVIDHLTAPQINWTKLITGIKVKSINSDTQYTLTIALINGQAYTSTNCVTNPGDNLILRFVAATTGIHAGDLVIVTINGDNKQFKSPAAGFMVN